MVDSAKATSARFRRPSGVANAKVFPNNAATTGRGAKARPPSSYVQPRPQPKSRLSGSTVVSTTSRRSSKASSQNASTAPSSVSTVSAMAHHTAVPPSKSYVAYQPAPYPYSDVMPAAPSLHPFDSITRVGYPRSEATRQRPAPRPSFYKWKMPFSRTSSRDEPSRARSTSGSTHQALRHQPSRARSTSGSTHQASRDQPSRARSISGSVHQPSRDQPSRARSASGSTHQAPRAPSSYNPSRYQPSTASSAPESVHQARGNSSFNWLDCPRDCPFHPATPRFWGDWFHFHDVTWNGRGRFALRCFIPEKFMTIDYRLWWTIPSFAQGLYTFDREFYLYYLNTAKFNRSQQRLEARFDAMGGGRGGWLVCAYVENEWQAW
ncbi:hypothetical protein QBC39DRAFT_348340 [Podospora conica]|nr:hypothetical protein QBC39DRAFT_348340 [Schizothecium conicum]